jgi:hypothetical protein
MTEFNEKQQRVQALLEKHNPDRLRLRRASNFAWATQ